MLILGTDSRFGFGYRLGEHADFQVQVELGPQTHTKPIGELNLKALILRQIKIIYLI